MRIVLDTNVLVSGLLSPFGTCGQIVRMLAAGEIALCADARILLEYAEVLGRPRFALDPRKVEAVLDLIRNAAEIHGSLPLARPLPDADDQPFLEVALAARADGLVTGNVRHFPERARGGMPVFTPQEFVAQAARRRR